MNIPRRSAVAVAVFLVGLIVATVAPTAAGGQERVAVLPEPDVRLEVGMVQDGRQLTYAIRFENVGEGVAKTVTLRDILPPGTTYLGDAEDLRDGVWTRTYRDVAPGAYVENISVQLPESARDGDRVVNVVDLVYVGYRGSPVFWTYQHEARLSFPLSVPLWAMAAPPVAGVGAVGGVIASRRKRSVRIEQIFLLHRSGALIHHWATRDPPARDIDIMSSMFVIIKEFVRDSFREKVGKLSEMRFGDSRIFLAEGQHAILAAVVNGERVNGLPAQAEAAIRDFEAMHGPQLADWSGELRDLPGGRAVVEGLVRGRYGPVRIAA